MNHKYNPWVSLVALLLMALILVLNLTGCAVHANRGGAEAEPPARFEIEFVSKNVRILTDTETGVQYLAYVHSNGAGLCKLEG